MNKTKQEIQDSTNKKGSGVTDIKESAQEQYLDSNILRLHVGEMGLQQAPGFNRQSWDIFFLPSVLHVCACIFQG